MTFFDLFSCRLLNTPIFPRRLSSVRSKFSHKKINFILLSPLDGVIRAVRLPQWRHLFIFIFIYIYIHIYTALRHRTYNQAVKVSACEGIDRYIHLSLYQACNTQFKIYSKINEINRTSEALQQTQHLRYCLRSRFSEAFGDDVL